MSFQELQWLFPVAVTLHNSEEAVWMLFERRYEAKGAPEIGWNACAKAAGSAA